MISQFPVARENKITFITLKTRIMYLHMTNEYTWGRQTHATYITYHIWQASRTKPFQMSIQGTQHIKAFTTMLTHKFASPTF